MTDWTALGAELSKLRSLNEKVLLTRIQETQLDFLQACYQDRRIFSAPRTDIAPTIADGLVIADQHFFEIASHRW